MKSNILNKLKGFFLSFLSLLGLSVFFGCKIEEPDVCMYGCPTTIYKFSSDVDEAQNMEEIKSSSKITNSEQIINFE